MKKLLLGVLSATCIASAAAALAGCSDTLLYPAIVVNGGFESGNLSGWTVEYGEAYDDDSVSSGKTFTYSADIDPHGYVIPVNQTGNWYLSGKGYDGKRASCLTGAIRSHTFVLGGDGIISMKLAGGASATTRAAQAQKPAAEICYVGIYLANNDKMVGYQTNSGFAEDPSNIRLDDYLDGTCFTDNFHSYELDLSDYIGEEMYIRIVDNDKSYYYGYLSVDDIRIGKNAEPQTEGAYFAKNSPTGGAAAKSVYDIANGDFETGNLSGWKVEGRAFSDDGVNGSPVYWAEQIPYGRDGRYHYGYYEPAATGVLRSSAFTLGGSGYATYKLGGCADNYSAYLRFVNADTGAEVLKISNFAYNNFQFPKIENGFRHMNLNQYRVNLTEFARLGDRLYIEAVDENTSGDVAGCIILDSVVTYYEEKPEFNAGDFFDVNAHFASREEHIPESKYQVINGGFETGDLTGWDKVLSGGNIGEVVADDTWWAERLPYNKSGKYLFSGINHEGGQGTLTSSAFEVGGTGWITFKLGAAHDPRFSYISIIAEDGTELERYGNHMFNDLGLGTINRGSNLANMVTYRANLSKYTGQRLRIKITDSGTSNWGLITCDSFVTYYAETDGARFPANTVEAINILPSARQNPPSKIIDGEEHQIVNGGFEDESLNGWTRRGGNIGGVSYDYMFFNECYAYNKEGLFFFNGLAGAENDTGTLTSSAFKVGGSCYITYRFGGGKDGVTKDNEIIKRCYIEVIDADNESKIYMRFGNEKFTDRGGWYTGSPIIGECEGFGAKMVLYKADLTKLKGKKVKLRIVDNATKFIGDKEQVWGIVCADDFVTYYANESDLPAGAHPATDIYKEEDAGAADVAVTVPEAMIKRENQG